jgi:hypothetical protein
MVNTSGTITTIAGNGSPLFSGDGGPAINAGLSPNALSVDGSGNVYIADLGNNRIRKVDTSGIIQTIAGNGSSGFSGDGGPATLASMNPWEVAIGSTELFVADHKNNRVRRIEGIVPPPPAVVEGVTASVTADTAMWHIHFVVDTRNILCPSVVAIRIDARTVRRNLCPTATGFLPFREIAFSASVFLDGSPEAFALHPGSTPNVEAWIEDSAGSQASAPFIGTVSVPRAPLWVGIGDSFSSGWRQYQDDPHCVIPPSAPGAVCNVVDPDPGWSWVSRATILLNVRQNHGTYVIPSEWLMERVVLARGGAKVSELGRSGSPSFLCPGCGQLDNLRSLIGGSQASSWNIVSITAGADDVQFSDALRDYYVTPSHWLNPDGHKPWAESDRSECPNAQTIYERLEASYDEVRAGLVQAIATARGTSPASRVINLDYPYVVSRGNVCFGDVTSTDILGRTTTSHGSGSVVDLFYALHFSIHYPNVISVDLRVALSDNPLPYLQQTRLYGYPHPSESGQEQIAQAAVSALGY